VICVGAVIVSCQQGPERGATEPVPPSPSRAPEVSSRPTPPKGATADDAPREVHPLDGNSDCMEMYTVCKPMNGESQCTGAPLLLACNETARLPSTGEPLRCVCP
jgi:hypothetical protein